MLSVCEGAENVLHHHRLLERPLLHAASVRGTLESQGCFPICFFMYFIFTFPVRCGNYFVTKYKLQEEYNRPGSTVQEQKDVKGLANVKDLKKQVWDRAGFSVQHAVLYSKHRGLVWYVVLFCVIGRHRYWKMTLTSIQLKV